KKEIRLARSVDGGKTWTQSPGGVDASGKSFDPGVAALRDRVVVVTWADERRGQRTFDIYARRSADGGATWEPEQILSNFPKALMSEYYARPHITTDGDKRVWVIWVGRRGGRSMLYLNRSTDAGRTWSDPQALTGRSESVFGQVLVRSGERFLLVWQDARSG